MAGILSFAIWGFFSIPLRNLQVFPSQEILYYRVFSSCALIWVAIILFRRKYLKRDIQYLKLAKVKERKAILFKIIAATIFLVLNWYTFIYAVNNVSLQSAAFAYMVCPLLTAFGGYILLKEKLSFLKLASLGIALISIILLATGSIIDVAWSVGIAILYAFYLIIQKTMKHLDKLNVLAVQISFAVVLMLPFYLSGHDAIPSGSWFWGNILVVALVFTIIPLFLSLYALIGIPSSTLGIIIYVNPIIAFTVAVFYFNEQIDQHKLFSYMLLVVSIVVFNWTLLKDIFVAKTPKG
ncbi:EamA family transporter [Pedobacter sp. JCM 36344]|uniref:EamA family transporter n=1 Tax=Pedobacter sp. JCM 36344 TaxID=3374280 RepID=UPI00397C7E0D